MSYRRSSLDLRSLQDLACYRLSAWFWVLFPRRNAASQLLRLDYITTKPPRQPGASRAPRLHSVSRLLEPERLAWKVLQLHHLSNAPHTRALAYGATILFSTVSISCLQLPARLAGYVTAFKALQPHRLLTTNAMPVEDVLNEPVALYSQGQRWGPNHLSLGVWGWGQRPAHQLIVRQAGQRLRLIQAQKHGILAFGALVCRPRLLPSPGSDQTSAQILPEMESRWTASLQASPSSRARLSSDLPGSQPAWMAPSRGSQQTAREQGKNHKNESGKVQAQHGGKKKHICHK